MSPYSIRCNTCHAKLKVRKPHAIGKIVNCPNCRAMVMISPPPPPGHPDEDAHRVNRRRISKPTCLSISEETYDQIAQILDQPPCDEAIQELVVEEVNETSMTESEGLVQESDAEVDDTSSETRSSRTRPWLLASVGAIGTIAVFAVFQNLVGGLAKNTSVMTATPPTMLQLVPQDVPQTTDGTLGDRQVLSSSVPLPNKATDSATKLDNWNARPTQRAISLPNPQTPEGPVVLAKEAEMQVKRADFQLDDAHLASEIASLNARDVLVSIQPVRHARSRAGLVERLREPLEIKINQRPFLRFVADMQRLANAPITIDAIGFVNQRDQVQQGISLVGNTMPLGRSIQAALKPTGLMIALDDDYLVIHQRLPVPQDDARFAKHDVSDLIRGPSSANLVRLVKTFVRPQAWQSNGGTAQVALTRNVLIIDGASTALHREVRQFCEQLRTFRGLPRISNGSHWRMQPAWVCAEAKFAQPLTIHITQSMSLGEVLVRLGEESGTYLLANWRELSEIGIDPGDRIKLDAEQQSCGAIVAAICHRLGAEHRLLGQDVCEITSREAASRNWETVFHRVDDLVGDRTRGQRSTPHELIASIYDEVGSEWFSPNRGAVEYDVVSQCLVVRLPQAQQRAVNGLLRSMRA